MRLLAILEAGREDFLEAVASVTAERASLKPHSASWSVLECIEHVVAAEDRYLRWISGGTTIPAAPDADKEFRLFTIVRSRLSKIRTPSVLEPRGRFVSISDALAAFQSVRARSLSFVRERHDEIYGIRAAHPHFGELNGAEWIQVMDGHARRHADQIREITESLQSNRSAIPMKTARTRKPDVFRRDEPDLPLELESVADPIGAFANSDCVSLADVLVKDFEKNELRTGSLQLEGSVMEHVSLRGPQIGSAVWKDVRLVGCDLANSRIHRMVLTRVELIDCRLTGFSANAVEWQDVLIRDSDLQYAQLAGARFRNCEFLRCNWTESDLQNADLTGSVFGLCNLAGTDLHGAKLQGVDFRGSTLETLSVGLHDLRGAIVNPAQAMVLAKLLGLQIR